MAITIKSEKIVTGAGIESRKILAITAITDKDLPELYQNSGPALYLAHDTWGKNALFCQSSHTVTPPKTKLAVDGVISEAEYQAWVTFITICGNRLRRINRKLAVQRAGWSGIEVEKI